jgi:ethanolamine transporter EutH
MFTAAIIFAVGVTALVALGTMLVGLRRTARLTIARGLATGLLALGVIAIATVGIVSLSPGSAQATPDGVHPTVAPSDAPDIQLPTLSLD